MSTNRQPCNVRIEKRLQTSSESEARSLIHVLKVTVNRRLESTAFDNKIKYTDRCIVT